MKELFTAIKFNLIIIGLTGFIFPLLVWGLAQTLMPFQANGSLVTDGKGNLQGSSIIGQQFTQPQYFHGRPSAAGAGYDAANSSGTNLGPTSSKLFNGVKDDPTTTSVDETYLGVSDLAVAYRAENGLPAAAVVPIDAVTRSASGLDPHISPANALLQAARVAKARNIDIEAIKQKINQSIEPRFIGIFGESRINVLKLNMLLDKA